MLSVKSLLRSTLPYSVRHSIRGFVSRVSHTRRLRRVVCDLQDLSDRLRGRHDPLTPPRKLLYGTGGGLEVAPRFLGYFRELCGLQPTESVLDVGCGVGRMTLPLTKFLTPPGRYEGFDIIPANIDWCRKAITPRFPHFRFQHANIFNREYNRKGTETGETYRFPFPDSSFDFSFLTSVFTHLMPAEIENYFRELARVVKPGGRIFSTFFLLNGESTRLVEAGRSNFPLYPSEGVYRVHNKAVPEMCIAYDETFIVSAAEQAGLSIRQPVRYGMWCGRENAFDYQDCVILTRRS